jgi:hypothetical protein
MPEKNDNVSMRVRIGDSELEVTGPKDFVEAKIDEFMKKHKEPTPRILPNNPVSTEIASPPSILHNKKMSIAQFFKQSSPRSDVDRVLFAGYYLEKISNFSSFTSVELRQAIRDAKVPPPQNPSDAINKNIKKGLIMSAGDKDGIMAFVLTSDGEETVSQIVVPA